MKNQARYDVTFEKAPEYASTFELYLSEINSFKYGNGSCVVVRRNGEIIEAVDTRYEKGIKERFEEWCDEYMEAKFNKDFVPHITKVV